MLNEKSKAAKFFSDVSQHLACENACIIIVTHLVPGTEVFLDSLAKIVRIAAVIPKASSIHQETLVDVSRKYPVVNFSRKDCSNAALITAKIEEVVQPHEKLIILDMGGYFAKSLSYIQKNMTAKLIGVVEDTENGHKRYEQIAVLPCPVLSVARSPLKDPEDFLVGHAIVFSAEALIRQSGVVMVNKRALVIGYGKIGRSIADALSKKCVKTMVYDHDPIRQVQAFSHGFDLKNREDALRTVDVVVCATGNQGLRENDFSLLKNGCFVISVTSADDELDIAYLVSHYQKENEYKYMPKYYNSDSHYFYLLNDGNAVNFVHHGVVGPYIYLIQSEILKSVQVLVHREFPQAIHTLPADEKAAIAKIWLQNYNGGH